MPNPPFGNASFFAGFAVPPSRGTDLENSIDQAIALASAGTAATAAANAAAAAANISALAATAASSLGVAPIYLASRYGVVADTGVDQADNINLALSSLPASGGKLLLPSGNILVAKPLVLTTSRVTLGSADNQFASHLVATTAFLTGDFLTITGSYSGVDGVAFDVQATPAQIAANNTPYRTSGYTINLSNGYGFVKNCSIRGFYCAIKMATAGGHSTVRDCTLEYGADGTAYPGSGGIDVNNTGFGPDNYIQTVRMQPNLGAATVYRPSFGVRLQNTGATQLNHIDVTGFLEGLIVVPGVGQRVEATRSSGSFWDDCRLNAVRIAPTGTGFVFDTEFTSDWITTTVPNANGLVIAGAASTGDTVRSGGTPFPVMTTKWIGGCINSTSDQTGSGLLVADTGSSDTLLKAATVSGWSFGVNLAAGASRVIVDGNSIGNEGFFDVPAGHGASTRTNNIGCNVASGAGDYISLHDNRIVGNTTASIGFAATGQHNSVHDNQGYNPVGVGPVTVGASPWVFQNGPTGTGLYIYGAAITVASINGAGLATASPCYIAVSPNQAVTVAYPGAAPTVIRNVQ